MATMLKELNISLLGLCCFAWTILLVFVSYIYIRRRQQDLLNKIEATNKMSKEVAKKNSEIKNSIDQPSAEESSNSEPENDENDDDDNLPLVKSDDILLEVKNTIERDPFEYCEHIQGEVKRLKQKITQRHYMDELTPTQLQQEREVQRKQMEAIFQLMAEKEGQFGMTSIDDMKSQMKMYI